MYSIHAYDYIIDLLQIQYEKLGGVFLPYEHNLLVDAAESEMQSFIHAIEQMFSTHLDIALLGAIDSCLYFTDYTLFFYYQEDVLEGLSLLQELVCRCCPIHAESASCFLQKARLDVIKFFSSLH